MAKTLMLRGARRTAAKEALRNAKRAMPGTELPSFVEAWRSINDPACNQRFAFDQKRALKRRQAGGAQHP